MKNKMTHKKAIRVSLALISIGILISIGTASIYAMSSPDLFTRKGCCIRLPSNNSCVTGTVSGSLRIYATIPEESLQVSLFVDGNFVSNGVLSRAMCEPDFRLHVIAWNTESFDNGLHELQIVGENGEIYESILVLIQN